MGRVVGTLFGLPFALVGIGMLAWTGITLQHSFDMSAWYRVDATVVAGGVKTQRDEDGTTYLAWGEYTYVVAGREYRSRRVAVSDTADNIGSFHEDLGARLQAAAASGQPIDAWVNPSDPSDAVVDRRTRWGLQIFKLLFGLVFGVVGGAVIWAAWRAPEPRAAAPASQQAATPWLANPAWQGEPIRSEARLAMRGAWIFAGLWNLVSAPLAFVIVGEVSEKQNYVAAVGLLFPIIGAGLLTWAVRTSREWWRFGAAPVELDPFPGAIGGHVGGRIQLATPLVGTEPVSVTLTLLSSEAGSDSRRESALWQEQQRVRAKRVAGGSQIEFRFDVPDELAASDANTDGGDYHLWRLTVHATQDGPDLNRTYQVPVYPTAARSEHVAESAIDAARNEQQTYDDEAIAALFRVRPNGIYPTIVFPIGRYLGMAGAGCLFGSVFAGAGYFLLTQASAPVMGIIFAIVGGLILVFSLYSAGNSLTITRDGAHIRTRRRWLGVSLVARSIDLMRIARYRLERTMSSQSGGRHVVYFSLNLVDEAGKEVCVGEGLRGVNQAEAMLRRLTREFGLPALPLEQPPPRSVRRMAAAGERRS